MRPKMSTVAQGGGWQKAPFWNLLGGDLTHKIKRSLRDSVKRLPRRQRLTLLSSARPELHIWEGPPGYKSSHRQRTLVIRSERKQPYEFDSFNIQQVVQHLLILFFESNPPSRLYREVVYCSSLTLP